MTKEHMLTVPQFAEEIGVNRFTVTKWVKAGKVKGIKQGAIPGRTSPILIPASELERLKKGIEEREKTLSS